MGIADGMSRLPTSLMGPAFAEDSFGADAEVYVGNSGAFKEGTGMNSEGKHEGSPEGNRDKWVYSVGLVEGRRRGNASGEEETDQGEEILEEGSSVLRWARWKKFLLSGFYKKVMLFKLGGIQELSRPAMDVGRNEMRHVVSIAERFALAEGSGDDSGRLIFRERDGCLAGCVVENEVGDVLRSMHDTHGHFSQGITAGRLFGHYYRPSRNADIARWIATCDSCQRFGPI